MTTIVRLTAPNGYSVELETDGKPPARLAKALVRELVKAVDGLKPQGGTSPLLRKLRDDRAREAR